ncbi:MAG: radical SAM protein [Endomicrobia bacterium]|nr:radical SAM protein [Endomicrobiia bacterium]MDW8056144.1 B12-binding domain-containing radical SAM protein [Elusimicrobiota bacterium]
MKVILVNPPIYDFSAYDVWIKPLGLLYLSNILKTHNIEVVFLDCLDRSYFETLVVKPDGTGKLPSTIVDKPNILKDIPLKYKRYGINKEIIKNFFLENNDADYLIISCSMTYWYLGIREILDIAKETLKQTKILLGGIYPTLVPKHAYLTFTNKVDYIFVSSNFSELFAYIGLDAKNLNFTNFPAPDYSHYKNLYYIVTRFSYGCHYNCSYCACRKIFPKYTAKTVEQFVNEVYTLYNQTKCKNFVFYDDELLNFTTTKQLFYEFLKLNLPIKFFTPNGLNPRFINKEIAKLMYELNFTDPRLSLEFTSDFTHDITDKKITFKEFEIAVENLINAGYKPHQISVYLLAGLPYETLNDVFHSLELLSKYYVRIRLCELSPVPKTQLYYQLGLDDTVDPLLHNNSIFIFNGVPGKVKPWCSYEELQLLKKFVKDYNESLKQKTIHSYAHY